MEWPAVLVLTLLFPSFACGAAGLLGFALNPTKWRIWMILYIAGIALFAYNYIPKTDSDIVRYYEILDNCRGLTYQETLGYLAGSKYVRAEGLSIQNILFYLVALTGQNGLLPAFSTGITYFVMTYITCYCAEKSGTLSFLKVIIPLQIICLPFFSVVNNVRNMLAFSLVIWAVFRELVQRKKDIGTLALYVLPCLLHNSGFVLVLLRLLSAVTGKMTVTAVAVIIFVPGMIEIAYQNRVWFNSIPIVQIAIAKAYHYMIDDNSSEWAIAVANSTWQMANRLIVMVLIFFMMYLYVKNHGKMSALSYPWEKYWHFMFFIGIATLACNIFTVPHYWRFAAAFIVSSGVFLVPFALLSRKKRMQISSMALGVLAFSYLLLQLYRMPLQTQIVETLANATLNVGITVVLKVIGGMII